VPGQLAASEEGHDHRLVRPVRPNQSDSPPYRIKRPGEPPWYVARMPGGVRGGDREGPPYSIVPPHELVIVGKPRDGLRSSRPRAMGPGFRRDGYFAYPNLGSDFFTRSEAGIQGSKAAAVRLDPRFSRGRRKPVVKKRRRSALRRFASVAYLAHSRASVGLGAAVAVKRIAKAGPSNQRNSQQIPHVTRHRSKSRQ
jgi:hypothetical protein